MSPSETSRLLRELYRDVNGFVTIGHGPKGSPVYRKRPLVYGELTSKGVRQLCEMAQLGEDDSFYDVGCGVGKIVIQMAITIPLKKCVGIELASERYSAAVAALRKARAAGDIVARSCSFRHQNMLDADLRGSTFIYFASTCFSNNFVNGMITKLHSSSKRCRVALLNALTRTPRGVELVKTHRLQTTWNARQPVFIYSVGGLRPR